MKMTFLKKRSSVCKRCGEVIYRYSPAVVTRFLSHGYYVTYCYHPECYKVAICERIDNWIAHHRPPCEVPATPKKRGKPAMNMELADKKNLCRLRMNRLYHRRHGHLDRVEKIEREIQDITMKYRPMTIEEQLRSLGLKTMESPSIDKLD